MDFGLICFFERSLSIHKVSHLMIWPEKIENSLKPFSDRTIVLISNDLREISLQNCTIGFTSPIQLFLIFDSIEITLTTLMLLILNFFIIKIEAIKLLLKSSYSRDSISKNCKASTDAILFESTYQLMIRKLSYVRDLKAFIVGIGAIDGRRIV
jgi:hypothetical protein